MFACVRSAPVFVVWNREVLCVVLAEPTPVSLCKLAPRCFPFGFRLQRLGGRSPERFSKKKKKEKKRNTNEPNRKIGFDVTQPTGSHDNKWGERNRDRNAA